MQLSQLDDAKHWLEKAKNDYKGFLVEVLVHLRIHAAYRDVHDQEQALVGKASAIEECAEKGAERKSSTGTFGGLFKPFS